MDYLWCIVVFPVGIIVINCANTNARLNGASKAGKGREGSNSITVLDSVAGIVIGVNIIILCT